VSIADSLEQLVTADALANGGVGQFGKVEGDRGSVGLVVAGQRTIRLLVRREQRLKPGAEGSIAGAFAFEKRDALSTRQLSGRLEQGFLA
jgi:hypothetical protein